MWVTWLPNTDATPAAEGRRGSVQIWPLCQQLTRVEAAAAVHRHHLAAPGGGGGLGLAVGKETLTDRSPSHELMVPTCDTARVEWLMRVLLAADVPAIFCGPSSTGKSVMLARSLAKLEGTGKYLSQRVVLTASTTAAQTRGLIEVKLERRTRGVLSAPEGKRLVVLVDDVSRANIEPSGAQPPLELLRQGSIPAAGMIRGRTSSRRSRRSLISRRCIRALVVVEARRRLSTMAQTVSVCERASDDGGPASVDLHLAAIRHDHRSLR